MKNLSRVIIWRELSTRTVADKFALSAIVILACEVSLTRLSCWKRKRPTDIDPRHDDNVLRIKFRSAKDRCEDPLVVTINPVVSDHRVTLTAAGDAEEWSGCAGGIIFSTRRGVGLFCIEHVGHLRDRERSEIWLRSWWDTVGINCQVLDQFGKVLRGWKHQLPLARS